MMREPKIPMLPTELPQQRIHEVVELPERPAEFNCEVDYGGGPPPKQWSIPIVRRRRANHGEQTTQTRGNCNQAATG